MNKNNIFNGTNVIALDPNQPSTKKWSDKQYYLA